jgi:hypothetical protein
MLISILIILEIIPILMKLDYGITCGMELMIGIKGVKYLMKL